MIHVEGLKKTYKVAQRASGPLAAAKAMFKREYKAVHALGGVSFQVDRGEIVGYIGPNGAGKSTTIKIMCGILVPDGGTCEVMGYTPWKSRKEYVRHIGVVFGQRTQLWWDVPILDSYELLRDIYKIPQKEYKKTLDQLADALNLSSVIHTPLRQLSLGQRMRVELGASLLHGPELLFLDEPTIGLDAVSKINVREFIKRMQFERETTVILTTHDMNDIEALTDRIVLIGKGNVLYDGALSALRLKHDRIKTLTLTFSRLSDAPQADGCRCLSFSPTRAVYQVDTQVISVPQAMGTLFSGVDVLDVQAESRPIEEIVARIYQEYAL